MRKTQNDPERLQVLSHVTIEQAQDAIFWLDSEARNYRVNAVACRMLGYSRNELLNVRAFDFSLGVETFRKDWKEIQKRKIRTFETVFRRKDRRSFPVEIAANYIVYQGVEYCCAIIRDITERKAREAGLKNALEEVSESRDKIDNIIRSVADGLIVSDPQGRIVLLNPAAEELLGLRLSEMAAQSIVSVLAGRTRKEGLEAFFKFNDVSVQPLNLEIPSLELNHPLIVEARNSVMKDRNGRRAGIITILHDVTRVRELERMKRAYISRAAHEMNTPLATIMGYAEILLNPDVSKELGAQNRK